MNPLLVRYPVRFTIPVLLLSLALVGSIVGYLLYSVSGESLIEQQALHFVRQTMERNQIRLNKYLQERNLERLHMNVALLAQGDTLRATLVLDENQLVVSGSSPDWLNQPMTKVSINKEGKEQLAGFFSARKDNPQGVVTLSRDRQTVYAVFPLRFGENPPRTGLLYHEHDLRELKAAGQKEMRRDIVTIFSMLAVISFILWIYFYCIFFRRTSLILETIARFGQGDDEARARIDGHDELATIATALDSTLDIKVAAQKQLRENVLLLKQLTDGLPLLIAYVDKDECFRIVNQEFEKWFYLKPEQIVGRHAHDLIGKQGYAEIADHVSQALQGKVVEHEDAIPIVDGGMRQFRATLLPHFENGDGILGCFLMAQDITQHKIDQELLQNAKEQWERTFDSILDEIITVQDKEFHVLQANSATVGFFGIPKEAIIGSYCYELFRQEKTPCPGCPAHAVLQDGKNHSAELYHPHLQKHFLVTISPMKDDQDEMVGLVHSAKDITEFKKLEQQLRQAQKMEAIGTLAGGIAHDFNNILTPILGYSELVAERMPSGSDEREMMQQILNSSMRARDLVRQILTFSRQVEQQRQPVLIHLIIKEALKLLRSSIPTTIAIEENVADCGMVMADPTQVHQVLMNLCTNAYHAMRETGGELSVSLSVVDLSPKDYLDNLALEPGPHVKLSVRDTGCGMPKELLERIFEPYFTTKKQGEGTGLGLSVVHGIVQSHHGHLTVYSEQGKGTEFHVYLPQVTVQGVASPESKGESIPHGGGTILVVDDEVEVGRLQQSILVGLGYEVLLCTSSAQALETFRQNCARIDLVLSDMTMPGMNGAELTRRIKQLNPAMPVVLCTGFSAIMDEEKARRMGIDGFLLKPILKLQLARTIHDVLAKKDGRRNGM